MTQSAEYEVLDKISLDKGKHFKKKLVFERLMLRRPNMNIIIVAKIKGKITESQLKKAIKRLRQKHSILASRIEFDEEQNAWLKNNNVPEIPIEFIQKRSNEDLMAKVEHELKHLFDFARGPLIRFVLLQSSEGCDLIVNGHHVICDALGLSYLIKDILLLAAEPERKMELLPDPPNFNDIIPNPPKGNLFFKLIMKIIKWRWNKKNISFNDRDYAELHREFWKQKESVMMWTLSNAETSKIISESKKKGVSVYSALCAAFQAAQLEVQGDEKSYFEDVVMPVSLRDRLSIPIGESLGLFATSAHPHLKYQPKKSFWSNARGFHEKIQRLLKDNENLYKSLFKVQEIPPSLVDSFYFQKYGILDDKLASLVLKGSGLNDMIWGYIISNLGKLDIPLDYGNHKLSALWGPFIYSEPAEKYLSILTLAGKMNFCFTYKDSLTSKSVILQLREIAMHYLLKSD